jgi:hypothetical protein
MTAVRRRLYGIEDPKTATDAQLLQLEATIMGKDRDGRNVEVKTEGPAVKIETPVVKIETPARPKLGLPLKIETPAVKIETPAELPPLPKWLQPRRVAVKMEAPEVRVEEESTEFPSTRYASGSEQDLAWRRRHPPPSVATHKDAGTSPRRRVKEEDSEEVPTQPKLLQPGRVAAKMEATEVPTQPELLPPGLVAVKEEDCKEVPTHPGAWWLPPGLIRRGFAAKVEAPAPKWGPPLVVTLANGSRLTMSTEPEQKRMKLTLANGSRLTMSTEPEQKRRRA